METTYKDKDMAAEALTAYCERLSKRTNKTWRVFKFYSTSPYFRAVVTCETGEQQRLVNTGGHHWVEESVRNQFIRTCRTCGEEFDTRKKPPKKGYVDQCGPCAKKQESKFER